MRRRLVAILTAVLAVAAAGGTAAMPSASAGVIGDPGTAAAVKGCGEFFSQPGHDPKRLWEKLNRPGVPMVVVMFNPVPEDGIGTATRRRPNGGSLIFWDPRFDITRDGVTASPCEVLYHELQHADDNNNFADSVLDRECSEIKYAEWQAVGAQNALRDALHLDRRTMYRGELFIGSSFEQCMEKLPPNPKPSAGRPGGGSSGSGQGSAAGSGSSAGSDSSAGSGQGRPAGSGPSVGSGLNPGSGSARGTSGGSGGAGSTDGGGPSPGSSGASPTNSVFGDPHVVTTDGLVYDLQQVGEFTAFTSKPTGAPRVQLRFSPVPGSDTASMVSAVAIGDDARKVMFTVDDPTVITVVDGSTRQDVTVQKDSERDLFEKVTVAASEANAGFSGSAYVLRWTDGSVLRVDSTRHWGMRVSFDPSDQAESAEPRGLLGNFNGDPADDLFRPDGRLVPPNSAPATVRSDFGDPWRITQNDSLFAYQSGESTETFTDRGFPRADPQFPASVTEQAQQVCRDAGVIDDKLLAACAFDVSVTGNPTLAYTAAAVARDVVVTDSTGSRPPDPTPVRAGDGPLRDGSRVSDAVTDPQQSKRFDLDLGGASTFYLADWHGTTDRCDQTFHINFVDVSHGNSPCTGQISTFTTEPGQQHPQLEIVSSHGGVGPFSFTLITRKPRELSVEPGAPVSGVLDVRGRQDVYTLPAGTDQLALSSSLKCAGDEYDFVFEVRDLTTGTLEVGLRMLCGDSGPFELPDQTHRYGIVIDNIKLKTGKYDFVVK